MIISRADAREMGFTHEGTIAGVPCWMVPDRDGNVSAATPKFQPLQYWMSFVDWLYDLAVCFLPGDRYFEFPIKVTGKI